MQDGSWYRSSGSYAIRSSRHSSTAPKHKCTRKRTNFPPSFTPNSHPSFKFKSIRFSSLPSFVLLILGSSFLQKFAFVQFELQTSNFQRVWKEKFIFLLVAKFNWFRIYLFVSLASGFAFEIFVNNCNVGSFLLSIFSWISWVFWMISSWIELTSFRFIFTVFERQS